MFLNNKKFRTSGSRSCRNPRTWGDRLSPVGQGHCQDGLLQHRSETQDTTTSTLGHQVPISPTFYKQLLCMQIPKAQKDNQLKQLFALSGSAGIKALHKHIDEIDPKFKRQTAPSYSDITEMERLCSRSGTIRERPKLVFLSFFEKKCKKKFRLKIFHQRV